MSGVVSLAPGVAEGLPVPAPPSPDGTPSDAGTDRRRHRGRGPVAVVVALAALLAAVAVLLLLARPVTTPAAALAPPTLPAVTAAEVAALERQLAALRPRGIQVRVDTVENRLTLVRTTGAGEAAEVVLDALCSTGTGGVLRDPAGDRTWVFDTPKGGFRVVEKRRDPVWTKPDWAFIEEGLPVPTDLRHRRDPESLGDYALYLGDGYLIHGTLYQRLLGRSVTHGCVRLGDADLAEVYRRVPPGAPVFIY